MKVLGVFLKNFRNYKELNLSLDADINILFGDNAQGKTNILESIYLCSCLRSHRTSKDTELIKHDSNEYEVKIEFIENENRHENEQNNFNQSIQINYYQAITGDPNKIRNKRIIRHNGIFLPKMSEMMGLFHAVIFAPEDLMMIKEGPSTRRRFVDILISQIRASYFSELGTFNKILIQRNCLLKQMRDGKSDKDYKLLEVWDFALSKSASKIIAARIEFTEKIGKIASKYHKEISSGKEEIYVKYKTVSGITPNNEIMEIESILKNKYKTMFYEDIDRGNTQVGPHKDDLEISLDGEGIRPFASQGQQRTAVLSLKIAELEIIKKETGLTPVLLLDDVMSELDLSRRKMLLSSVGDAQIILTCTDKSHVINDFENEEKPRTIRYYKVSEGLVL